MPQRVLKTGFFSKILLSVFIAFFVCIFHSFGRVSEKLYSLGVNSPWNSNSTWSLASNGIPSGLVPQPDDTLVIEGSVILNTNFVLSGNGSLIISGSGILQGSNFELSFTGNSSITCYGELKINNLLVSGNSLLAIEDQGNVLVYNMLNINAPYNHVVQGKLTVLGTFLLADPANMVATGMVTSEVYSGNGSISGVKLSENIYNRSIFTENNWLGLNSNLWDEPLNWSLGIVPTINSNASVLVSANNPEIVGDASCKNLFVSSSAKLIINQNAVLEISGNLSVNENGKLVLKNSILAKASLILNGDVTGKIQSEYQIEAGKKCLLSSPVATAMSSTFLNMYLRSYDESSSQWGEYIVPTNNPLQVMQGYELYSLSPATRIFDGVPNHDPKSFSISNTGNGLNLTGNPYPCYIDWENNDNNAWQRNAVASAIYYPDPSGSGNFSVYLPGGENSVSLNNGSRYIAPMQGFFVKAGQQGALTINGNSRVRSLKDSKQGITNNLIKFKLNDSNGMADEAAFRVIESSTFGFDDNMDALKLAGNDGYPSINFGSEGEAKYAIHTIPTLDQSTNVPLNIECSNAGMFTISTSGSLHFAQKYPIVLKDKELNISIDLIADSVYTFYHSPSMDSRRFELQFSTTQGISGDFGAETQIQTLDGEILITGKANETYTANLFSIEGKLLNSTNGILSEGIRLNTGSQHNTICILQLRNSGKSSTSKILIR